VLANRRHGPEQILSIVDERAPDGFAQIDDVLSRDELVTITEAYRRTAGFDVENLNTRASWSVEPAGASGRSGASPPRRACRQQLAVEHEEVQPEPAECGRCVGDA
jgi:hypothetical protein